MLSYALSRAPKGLAEKPRITSSVTTESIPLALPDRFEENYER